MLLSALALALGLPVLAAAHGLMLEVPGANGKTGVGIGAAGATLTGNKGHDPFYYAPRWYKYRNSPVCGYHRYKGTTTMYPIDWKSELNAQVKKGLPTARSSGGYKTVTIKYYQVNTDGAGKFSCAVSTKADGKSWKAMKVTTNVPGDSKSHSALVQRYHTLEARLPKGVKCSGPGGACLVRCQNQNINAFGGCVAVSAGGKSKRSPHAARALPGLGLGLVPGFAERSAESGALFDERGAEEEDEVEEPEDVFDDEFDSFEDAGMEPDADLLD